MPRAAAAQARGEAFAQAIPEEVSSHDGVPPLVSSCWIGGEFLGAATRMFKVTERVPYWDYNATMKVIAVATLRRFWASHPDAEQPLRAWHDEAARADWKQPAHSKAQYRSASILKSRRVVFNIRGNDYRLIVAVAYKIGVVYVKFIGTHAQYDEIDAETVEIE